MAGHIIDLVATDPQGSDDANLTDNYLRAVHAALLQDVNGFASGALLYGEDGTNTDAYVLTPTTPLNAYENGLIVYLVLNGSAAANTITNPTLNISGLGAKQIRRLGGSTTVLAGDIVVGVNVLLYHGTSFHLLHSYATEFKLDKNYTFTGEHTHTELMSWSEGTTTAAANDLTLPTDGNYVRLSAASPIDVNGIANTYQAGTVFFLELAADITFKDNTAPSGGFTKLDLPGDVDYTSAAGDFALLFTHGVGVANTMRFFRKAELGILLDEDDMSSDSTAAAPTQQSAKAYTDTTRPKAYCKFTGVATPVVTGDMNIASVVRDATGRYTVTLTNAMSDSNYVIQVTSHSPSGSGDRHPRVDAITSPTVFSILFKDGAALNDPTSAYITVFGTLA